jgi:hypothetical protein
LVLKLEPNKKTQKKPIVEETTKGKLENNVIFKFFPSFEKYSFGIYVVTLTLGSQLKQRLRKVQTKSVA